MSQPPASLPPFPGFGSPVQALGTDLVYIPRVATLLARRGDRFQAKILREAELEFCMAAPSAKSRLSRVCARIAAKEATAKALGIGFATLGHPGGAFWRDIALLREEYAPPTLHLSGRAEETAARLGLTRWLVSVSHDGDYAMAVVLGQGYPPEN